MVKVWKLRLWFGFPQNIFFLPSLCLYLTLSLWGQYISFLWMDYDVWVVIRHSILQAAISVGEKGLRCLNITMCQAYSKTTERQHCVNITFVLVYDQNSTWQCSMYLDVHMELNFVKLWWLKQNIYLHYQLFSSWYLNRMHKYKNSGQCL